MGKQAMDANDIQKINLFLAEMQAALATQQASNLAQATLALNKISTGAGGFSQADLLGSQMGTDYDRGPDEQRIWEEKERQRLAAGAAGTGGRVGKIPGGGPRN